MIASLLLATSLAGAPGPGADRPSLPSGANPAGLDVPVTLSLRDAALVDVLEKLADLLGVTPIFEPGLSRRLTLELREVPASKALEAVKQAAGVDIALKGRVMRVSSRGGERSASAGAAAPPRWTPGFGDVVRFWRAGAEEQAVSVRVPSWVGRIELPGCEGPVTIARLGPWNRAAWGLALAVKSSSGGRATARILDGAAAEGMTVLLPGCDGNLVVAAGGAPAPGTREPASVEPREPVIATIRVLEVTEEGEESVAEPRVQFSTGAGWSVKSGFAVDEAGTVEQELEMYGVPLETDRERGAMLLAIYAGMTRGPASKDGPPTLVARRAESLWLSLGRPVRWTVDSSWDGGRAAIVVELTLLRLGEAPR